MNGSIVADATETAHRRGGTADAVRTARDAAESRETVGEARVSSTPPRHLSLRGRSGDGNATAPQRSSTAETGGALSAEYVRH